MNSGIGLLLVTYNRATLLQGLLSTIMNSDWVYDRFIIVNNASTDESAGVLKQFEKSLKLEILHLHENIGHGAGIASGLDQFCKGNEPELVVFMEDDSIPEADYLGFLTEKITENQHAMISSKGSLVKLGKRIRLKPIGQKVIDADFILFDGAIARFSKLKKVGFPVRDWFMMFDDFEYCYRIRKSGFKLGVVQNPYVKIKHAGWGEGMSHSSKWRAYYQARNFVHFVRLHFSFFNFFDCLILQIKRLIGGVFAPNGIQSSKMRILGIRAGFIGKKGKSMDLLTLKEH